ncbi:MAG: hypothetical protein U9R08_03725 [Nanoarchaeota archaeon]|nr:hypothetical protein [Nanoarchaeota archaeon]
MRKLLFILLIIISLSFPVSAMKVDITETDKAFIYNAEYKIFGTDTITIQKAKMNIDLTKYRAKLNKIHGKKFIDKRIKEVFYYCSENEKQEEICHHLDKTKEVCYKIEDEMDKYKLCKGGEWIKQ